MATKQALQDENVRLNQTIDSLNKHIRNMEKRSVENRKLRIAAQRYNKLFLFKIWKYADDKITLFKQSVQSTLLHLRRELQQPR